MSRKMKDSGVEWIGEIPEDWEKSRLKDYYRFEKGKNAALYTQEYLGENPGPYPVYSGQTENDGIMGLINSYDYDINECLFTTTVGAKVMSPRILKDKFSLSQNCLIMINTKECDNRFFYYSLYPLFEYERSLIPTYMQPSLRISDLNRYQIYVPNVLEQQKIANFLDQKVAEIDHILDKTRESIEEYKKYKQSIITEAVTKGLNPDVEMKDSGIEWIGEVPEHWEVKKMKYLAQLNPKCKTDEFNDETIVTFTPMECLYNGYFENKEGLNGNLNSSYTPFENQDIIIAKVTPCFENGNIAIADNLFNGFGYGSSELFVIRCSDVLNKFLFYYLQNKNFIEEASSTMTGVAGLKRVSSQFIKNAHVPIPDIREQQQIVDYLDRKKKDIDSLIIQKEQLLSDLESYKKSLIYECVTGKREIQ